MQQLDESQLSILLIEPSTTQLKIIMRELQAAGVKKIDGVSDAEAALDQIRRYPPDLVISAMYLPDSTAVELLQQIRAENAACLFMLISSETDPEALEPLRQAGVVAILPKPFQSEDLRRALHTTVDHVDPQELQLENYDPANLRVLLVDDSTTSRNHIGRILDSLGIGHIVKVENGLEAITHLQKQPFDLVVSDLNMPEMDGQALTQFVRKQLGDTFLPILIVTSEQDETRLSQVQQSGISALMDKPFEPEIIRQTLCRLLDGTD
ncbi:Chemotaxis regulator - transmits chemoreceptor signals to flagelllar motor components CheY [Methylophaga frappieri]|uniref:Chemotaxis regulator-transmits chemoreceptor signals to flagelllar motor components CheY n=1 Tax=Methylophaga frappieri (strain ATCC BAA-2434 / DSM 25690 / JAM7) TaxID=754477 RepID=I1YJQ1_METFJ|nr:response regulator [Methylophaga frappieri]AFJ03144.1 Chemotaxis regulator - transmits chemoreceptor signals to flagelllar motor components CheY [Methylophaga frappieri]